MVDRSTSSLTTRWRAIASIAMVVVIAMLPLLSKTHSVGRRTGRPTSKATPEAAVTKAPTTAPTPAATSTPEPFNPDTASHDQVIAQGLAIFDVAPAIWRVTEIDVPRSGDASSFSGDFSFTLQMEGLSVIRNDVTSKRALLGPGEAYYMSSEDPYTRRSGGSGASRAWVIEYLPADASDDDAGGTVIYKSDPINTFPGGARDLELIANTIFPGESAPFPKHQGDALLLVTSGTVVASAGGGVSTLNAGNGLLLPGEVSLANKTDNVATYVVVAIGGKVSTPGVSEEDTTAGSAATEAATEEATTSRPRPRRPRRLRSRRLSRTTPKRWAHE